jgi:predicted AAA+ superfamily ATPase
MDMSTDYSIKRSLLSEVKHHVERGKSVLLLGPRQVGKTTLLKQIPSDLQITLLRPSTRLAYEKDPERLYREIDGGFEGCPLVILDEIQRVPVLMDIVQELIDAKKAQFILTGSSARKLKKQKVLNLLPGRVISLRLDSLTQEEHPQKNLEEILFYGSLPEVVLTKNNKDKNALLRSYVETYLEEEVRAEALVRDIGPFSRFLELAGMEAGRIINSVSLAQEIGIDPKTIANYFSILFDCLVAERIDPLSFSETRKKLVKSHRYLFFDLGVRRFAAGEGSRTTEERKGQLFEQWIGIELVRRLRLNDSAAKLRFWKDADGPEVDWVIDMEDELIPIEVKWTNKPCLGDAKHLKTFLREYKSSHRGYVICRCPRRQKLNSAITALPWDQLNSVLVG